MCAMCTRCACALGWASAVLAQDAHYLKALRKYANRTHVAEDDSALCEAIGNGEVWPHARAVSLWSVGSLIDDGVDTIDCEARRGDAGLYGANCMGAPCFANEYKGTPASTWDLTCVCPVHEYGATLADIKLAGVYGDYVHMNNGTHLAGGVADDAAWQR